jgi:radical SAM protein with 4Fe4S-binding SPASM domain
MCSIKSKSKWKIGWGFTAACNMNCSFCYSKSVRKDSEEVSLETAINFIEQNNTFITSINYGTGECTLSKNWFILIDYIRQNYPSIEQALTTNGSLSYVLRENSNQNAFLKSIDEIDISLDFVDATKHNAMRNHNIAFDWVLETLEICQKAQKLTTIVVLGTDKTLESKNLNDIFNLAAKYNAFVRINILRPTGQKKILPPSYKKLMASLGWILKNHKVVSLCDPLFGSIYQPLGNNIEATGVTSLRILPDGHVTPSTYLVTQEWLAGNINNNICLDNLKLFEVFQKNKNRIVPVSCEKCTLVKTCQGGAIDRRYLHYKTLAERDPYCPLRHNEKISKLTKINPYLDKRPEVHDGYLPTLIFAPNKESL